MAGRETAFVAVTIIHSYFLTLQLLVLVADDEGAYVSPELNSDVVTLLHQILLVREALWKKVHYAGELVEIQLLICRYAVCQLV